MSTTQFDTTITADRTIRLPDDWDFEVGTPIRVIKLSQQPPTDEEADEMMASIKARAAELDAGIDEPDENGLSLKSFVPMYHLPDDWRFDREEIHERG